MKTKTIISVLLGAVVIAKSMSVYAINDGHLDGVWFKTDIRTTVKPYHSALTGGPVVGPLGVNSKEIKFDSGKDSCYSTLRWEGDITFLYTLHTFCKRFGKWEYINTLYLDEFSGGVENSVGSVNLTGGSIGGSGNIYKSDTIVLPAKGKSIHDRKPKVAMYEGTLILKPILDSAGNIKEVKLVAPQDGTIVYSDFEPFNDSDASEGGLGFTGTAPSGLSMKQVDPRRISKGAKACLDSVLGVGPAIHNCQ